MEGVEAKVLATEYRKPGITFLRTITFILVIASLVQMVEIMLKKVSPALYQALGIFLPLITTNCAILGVAVLAVQNDYNLIESVVFATTTSPIRSRTPVVASVPGFLTRADIVTVSPTTGTAGSNVIPVIQLAHFTCCQHQLKK